jgi:hypothetical protein
VIPQASVPTFNAALGANDINTLSLLPLDELKRDLETINKNQANVNLISTVASKRLMALRTWVEYKLLRNKQMAVADFDLQVLDHFLQIVVWLGKIDKEMEQDRVTLLVPTLKNSTEWPKFKCQVHAQMQTHRSPILKHSLRYVICPHDEVTHEMLDDGYLSLDADLYMTANLEEAQYHADNARGFGLLKVWLCHTEWWTFIHQYDATNDGCAAWLALKGQMEGPVVIEPRARKVPKKTRVPPWMTRTASLAVEDSKPAAVPFSRAAYKKPDTTQVVAAVAVEAQPEAEKEKKPRPEPRGVIKGWNQFITSR